MAAGLLLNGRTLDIERAELCDASGRPIQLRPQALSVLLELARRPGEVVTKRDLMERVWPGIVVTDDSLVQCVVEIRRELGDTRQRIVRTIPRRGYLLIADRVSAPADRPPASRRRRTLIAAIGGIAAAALLAWLLSDVLGVDAVRRKAARDADGPSLAVLPLRELDAGTGTPAPSGFGLAYMIAGELARNPDLHVVSTLVTAELRAKGMSVSEIGSTTGARYIVDGSVERRGDRLGLELQVVETGNGHIAWSGRFDPTAHELPGVTQLLLERIGASLGSTVRELRLSASLTRPPASLDAHALTLHGIALSQRPSRDGLRQARQELEQAVRLDPNNALAWAHLGFVKAVLMFGGRDPQLTRQDLPHAIADIRRAIALDPSLASSWRLLSIAIDSSQNIEEVVQAAERAVELGPGDPDNWLALGLAQYHARQIDAGLRNVEKALSWNRVRPPGYAVVEARLRYAVRDYERARRSASDCMERAPALVVCKAIWLSSSLRAGHAADAEAAWPRLVAAAPSLQSYRYAPRDTPEARAIEEDLDRFRGGKRMALP
jgi:DNA-binding winged helix-turn-helix (wHTH) protein/TolB-like protein/Flp pilus assembly protein TadD